LIQKSQRRAALVRQIERVNRTIYQLSRTSDRLSNIRLLIVVVGVGATVTLFTLSTALGWGSLLISLLVFGVIVYFHRRVLAALRAHELWRDLKQTHIARMDLDWQAIPAARYRSRTPHMLAVDLDLDNLHRLVSTATSKGGSERLYEWLIPDHPQAEASTLRQTRVNELVARPRFRDKLSLQAMVAADELQKSGEGQSLLDWLAGEPIPTGTRRWLIVLSLLAVFNIVNIVLVLTGIGSNLVLTTGFLVYALIFSLQYRRLLTIFDDALTIEAALRRLSAVMTFLERERYNEMLSIRELVRPVLEGRPSRRLREITGILSGISLRGNPIFWLVVNVLIPWDYYFGWRLEGVKEKLETDLPAWLDVWHELEALASLATHAYLNPAYTVPRIGDDLPVVFDATAIGHPLIPDEGRITNDFMMTEIGDIVIVTGSNMSGKSSFLRTLGVNLALAYAGGRVCAEGLDTMIFRLFTSIRVTDSLDDGISYFYAEVRRLRALLDALNEEDQPPLFFLIDEIFRGTNNRERLIGSRSYIRALADSNGVGLVATHDLELVKLSKEDGRIRNAHFREEVMDGKMVFDYTLRSGPSPTTNALRIMAMEGLPVEGETVADG
jgi:ABC-type multidrug transport system fused ATPase/permease subunit